MSNTRRYFALFFGLLLMANSSFAQNEELQTRTVTLYGADHHLGLNTYDFASGTAFSLKEAGYNPTKIHLGYLYGNNNKSTLLVPASKTYTTFGTNITDMVTAWGKDRNDGVLINIGNELEAIKAYNSAETGADAEKLYQESLTNVSAKKGYSMNANGPADKISNVKLGDIIMFKSTALAPYYLMKVLKVVPGYEGEIQLEIKGVAVEKKAKKKKKD